VTSKSFWLSASGPDQALVLELREGRVHRAGLGRHSWSLRSAISRISW
jgi:hypothetical protein